MYYNYDKILTYPALLNFIIGERGVGKSYGIKKHVIKRFKKKKRKFIYLRRYASELELSLKDNEFFKDIKTDADFVSDDLYSEGGIYYCNGDACGYAVPLSKQAHYKSIPYPDVDIIIFDEVFITNGRYLKNEIIEFLEFIETVARMRNIKVFLLSNNISIANPYFDYFNLCMPYKTDIKVFKNGSIVVQYIDNPPYRQAKSQSSIGKLISGTKYGDYAINNKALADNSTFIKKRTGACQFFFTVFINNHTFGVWRNIKDSYLIVCKDYDSMCPIKLSFSIDNHTENTILSGSTSPYYKNLLAMYKVGKLYFENQSIKNDFMLLIRKQLY